MRDRVLFWSTAVFCTLTLLLFVANVSIINGNRGIQQNISERAAFINNAQTMSNLNQSLAQTLADISAREKDTAIRELLSSQGIMISETPAAAPAAEAAKPRKRQEQD